ncbi:MAG: hypothetical protein M3R39_08900 [Actinomycetota bacterium]|nr:hypothetical protein [Actinomycetota bacterium]
MHDDKHAYRACVEESLVAAKALARGLSEEEQQELVTAARERFAEEELARQETALGVAFSRDASGPNALGKLSRYETAIERVLFRNLDELMRLQAARADQGSP